MGTAHAATRLASTGGISTDSVQRTRRYTRHQPGSHMS